MDYILDKYIRLTALLAWLGMSTMSHQKWFINRYPDQAMFCEDQAMGQYMIYVSGAKGLPEEIIERYRLHFLWTLFLIAMNISISRVMG